MTEANPEKAPEDMTPEEAEAKWQEFNGHLSAIHATILHQKEKLADLEKKKELVGDYMQRLRKVAGPTSHSCTVNLQLPKVVGKGS